MIEIQKNKKQFIDCLDVISNLVMEVTILFEKDKIYIRAVHPSNHCMIILNILPSLFEKYEIDKERVYTLDTDSLCKILKNLTEDKLEIYLENDVLVFKDIKNVCKLNYFVGTKDNRPTPTFDYNSTIKIQSTTFFDVISKCLIFDQIGAFDVNNNDLIMKCKSHMIKSEMKVDVIELEGSKDNTTYFDFSYIDLVKNIKNVFKNITLKVDSQFPLNIIGKNDDIKFEFILANRVEEEGE